VPIVCEPPIPVPPALPRDTSDLEFTRHWVTWAEEIETENDRSAKLLSAAEDKKIALLCRHFGIRTKPMQDGWAKDLALALAHRHEALFAKRGHRKYSTILKSYGIKPSDADADRALAIAIARKHVGGFQRRAPDRPHSRMSQDDLIRLAKAAAAIELHHEKLRPGKIVSVRKVVKDLKNRTVLTTMLDERDADEIAAMINGKGNNDRSVAREVSDTTLSIYLGAMRTALAACRAQIATDLQKRFVEEVFPALHAEIAIIH
jgi:hypothetical protein